jgi:hypothetical protein
VLRHHHIVWQIEIWPAGLALAGLALDEVYELLHASFTHFVDLCPRAEDRQPRPTAELAPALAYVELGIRKYTNVLLYNTP